MKLGAPTTVRAVRLTALAAAVAVVVLQFVDYGVYHLRIRAIDSLTHASVPGIASLLALAVAAGGALVLAAMRRDERAAWIVLGGSLTVLLALRLAYPPHVLVLALPFTAVALVALLLLVDPAAGPLLRDGALVLVGAYAVHAFGAGLLHAVGYTSQGWPYQAKAVVKHAGELAGWILVAGGVLAIVAAERRSRRRKGERTTWNSLTLNSR